MCSHGVWHTRARNKEGKGGHGQGSAGQPLGCSVANGSAGGAGWEQPHVGWPEVWEAEQPWATRQRWASKEEGTALWCPAVGAGCRTQQQQLRFSVPGTDKINYPPSLSLLFGTLHTHLKAHGGLAQSTKLVIYASAQTQPSLAVPD